MKALFAPGAKRTRVLAAVGLALLLAAPAVLLWAGRVQPIDTVTDEQMEQRMAEIEGRRLGELSLPPAFYSPVEFSPFGGLMTPQLRGAEEAKGMVLTPLGHRSWDITKDELRARLPQGLLAKSTDYTRDSRGNSLWKGLNYIQADPAAIQAKGLDRVLAEISSKALIVDALPNSTYLVYVEAANVTAVREDANILHSRIVEPGDKVSLTLGARPQINMAESRNPNLLVYVTLVPGKRTAALLQTLRNTQGVSEVTENAFDETGVTLRVHYSAVGRLARLDQVRGINHNMDMMDTNSENVPTVQAGSADDTLAIRPFDDAGVDGGGLNAAGNPTGTRVNNGTAQVPPQIVSVIDNGISADTPNFSQTSAAVTDGLHPIGVAHRKLHSIIAITDNGNDCDATLSGSHSHGNIVAATIAAYPSELGFFANRSGIGGTNQPRNANMDGVARGARLMVTDVGDNAQCTLNTLVEKGGNVSPGVLLTRLNEVICPKVPGGGACAGITGGATEVHLAVLPFGAPSNFSTTQFIADNGTYPQQAADLDTFLYNNRDFMIAVPVGNNGGLISNNRLGLALRVIPDLFNGTAADEDPNVPQPIQISAPATAKNIISVGGSTADCLTFFGTTDCENGIVAYTSRGPATQQSKRMAPLVVAPQFDLTGNIQPFTASVATFRSRDNDNNPPIEAQLDEANFGTSFAAGYITGAAAIVRDYLAQGFYPSGGRLTSDRVANISGAVVKAALAASTDFAEGGIGTQGQDNNERNLRRTRALDVGAPGGDPVGIMGNSEQGFGRPILTQVLPLANWSDSLALHGDGTPFEYPAAGLLIWDHYVNGEAYINNGAIGPNAANTSKSHIFRVASPNTVVNGAGGRAVINAELRIALAWPDRPSGAGAGGPLINDLDLELEGPGPDGCLGDGDCGTAADNEFYDGNNYGPGNNNASTDQWSVRHLVGGTEKHDRRNPVEAIHLNADPNNDCPPAAANCNADSPIYTGRWKVTVKRGCGGSNVGTPAAVNPPICTTPGNLTILATGGANGEDANNNGRLDAGEDGVNGPGNGLLDVPGQDYALIVAGPVVGAEGAVAGITYPVSQISFTRVRYGCASNATVNITDTILVVGDATKAKVCTTYVVRDTTGTVVDTESGVNYTVGTSPGTSISTGIPIRLAGPGVPENGILEGDTGYTVTATYAPGTGAAACLGYAVQKPVTATAAVTCSPDLIPGYFAANASGFGLGTQYALANGCDNDDNFDAGEVVTYGVLIQNRSRTDDYADVTGTLTPSGPGAAAIRVLDSPKVLGRVPGNGLNGVFFHVFVDPSLIPVLATDRKVTMTLTIDSLSKGQRIGRQSYAFTHAINSDRQTFYYSTDRPTGGREVRDLNRNLVIDPSDSLDPFARIVLPNEDVTFDTLELPSGTALGVASNRLGEDLDNTLTFTGTEFDVIPNGIVDGGILKSCRGGTNPGRACNVATQAANCGAGGTCGSEIPWSFDTNNGGWNAFRHAASTAANISSNPLWEYKTNGLCGYQTQSGTLVCAGGSNPGTVCTIGGGQCLGGGTCSVLTGAGMYHTGDGDPTTPSNVATACDNHAQPFANATPAKVELVFDVLESPVVQKVHQLADSRGFDYTAEFARVGFNENIQLIDGYAGGGLNIDNDIDNDAGNSLLNQRLDPYYTRRAGGWPYSMFRFAQQYFDGEGVDPLSTVSKQRTFGTFTNPNASATQDGDETGFSGATQNTNPDSSTPIPTATADFLPFPLPGAPVACVCDFTGVPCTAGACPGGGVPHFADNDAPGPVRSFDASLVGYEGGFGTMLPTSTGGGLSAPENFFFFLPGRAGNRWQIGLGFWSLESPSNDTDYGVGVDDVVFEWKEFHPEDEVALGHTAACLRFNQAGEAAGGQCATLTVDRTNLFECDASILITVFDAKCRTVTAGACGLGGAGKCSDGRACSATIDCLASGCTSNAQCGGGGVCTANLLSVPVQVVTDTDSLKVSTARFTAFTPVKTFTLPAVPGTPGLYQARVEFSTTVNDSVHVFTTPGSDGVFTVYYKDDLCDGNTDGLAGKDDFDNIDGDNVPKTGFPGPCTGGATASCNDNCPEHYNPAQADGDSDGVGDVCDNCPADDNSDQEDTNADSVGDVCENDDFDADGLANEDDDCPDVVSTGTGERCATPTTGTCDIGGSNTCTAPPRNVGRPCVVNNDCNFMDRDFDGVIDAVDNCVSTYNPSQSNNDGDAMGDSCDPDCTGPAIVGVCRANPWKSCQFSGFNSGTCAGGTNDGTECISNAPCTGGGTCSGPAFCTQTVAGTCSVGLTCTSPIPSRGRPCTTPGPDAACDFTPLSVTGLGINVGSIATCFQTGRNNHDEVTGVPGLCSLVNDDVDVDNVPDATDNCPTVSNPPIIANTQRQLDTNRNGLGDTCDPVGNGDTNRNGIPDDVVTFTGAVNCRNLPLANLTLLSAVYHDNQPVTPGTGDNDGFPDTGETGRVKVSVRNGGVTLTDAQVVLTTTDPDVACITSPVILVGTITTGSTVTIGTIPGDVGFSLSQPGFQFVMKNVADYNNPGPPTPAPRVEMCITVIANETLGVPRPTCFALLGDVNLPGTPQTFTLGPDGLASADDGLVAENFDIDKNGDAVFTVDDTWLEPQGPGATNYRGHCSTAPATTCQVDADCPAATLPDIAVCYRGHYLQSNATGVGVNVVAGVPCGGYDDPSAGNPGCILAPNYYMDWHFHCVPGATNCPNDEELQGVGSGARQCNPADTCSFDTPANGIKAHSCPNNTVGPCNSLHMGAHFDPADSQAGDTTHFRTLQAFVSGAFNLAAFPRTAAPPTRPDPDLTLSFFHIARLMDNNGVSGGRNQRQCTDCGDVQIQTDRNVDPTVDDWGFWDKLVPFQNVYDHKVEAFSAFAAYYCVFTPTDTGTAPPAPRTPPVHETLCYPQGAWSHCGSTIGTTPATTIDCAGPGEVDPSGVGVWVQTKFNLDGYLGQRVRIRWIAEAWYFGNGPDSYFEVGPGWNNTTQDDGWWLDDILLSGTITEQITPIPDTLNLSGSCPGLICNPAVTGPCAGVCSAGSCTNAAKLGESCLIPADCNCDNGTVPRLKVTDLAGTVLDGTTTFAAAGQSIRVSAIQSTIPGGCVNGAPEFQFFKDGSLVQDWSTKTFYLDAPETTASYHMNVRCSTNGPAFPCTSSAGKDITAAIYSGDGDDAFFGETLSPPNGNVGVTYYRGVCVGGSNPGAGCNSLTDGGASADCLGGGTCDLGATAADASNDTVLLRWNAPGNQASDLYRGSIGPNNPPPGNKGGTLAAPFWTLDTTAPLGAGASCKLSNVAGTPTNPGSNYTSTPALNQAADPNPAVGSATYYLATANAPGGSSTNALGCANPGLCNNKGWCIRGSNAGAPCSNNTPCTGSGTCQLQNTFCSTDTGTADFGGCGRHQVCTSGKTGRLCIAAGDCNNGCTTTGTGACGLGGALKCFDGSTCATNADCVGSTCTVAANCGTGGTCTTTGATCPALAGTPSTAGQRCFNLTGILPPKFNLNPTSGCPGVGHPKRLVRQVLSVCTP